MRLRGFDDSTSRERGAVAVEFAILLPVLIMLVFGLIDFGRAYNEQISLTQVAREGARLASLNIADFKTRLVNTAPASLKLAATDIVQTGLCTGTSTAGSDATVTVTKTFTFTLPVGKTLTLTGKATMPCLG